MAHTRERMKGRRSRGSFLALPHTYFTSVEYAQLSPRAVKALLDLAMQFKGANNGDLCAAWRIMRALGWSSKDQLAKALQELLDRGWIVKTRQGGRRMPTLYAVTFIGIDPCGDKLDVSANPVPQNLWRRAPTAVISLPRRAGQTAPPGGSTDSKKATL